MTNTNQNVAFNRMFARGASIDIDGVYSNPAGLAYMEDGIYTSLTIQSAFQNRDVLSFSPMFVDQQDLTKKFHGSATAPVIPSFQFAYKKKNLAVSAGFAVVGGGGKCKFDSGLPSFSMAAIALMSQKSQGILTPLDYTITTAMEGRQYIYGLTAGASYKFHKNFSAYVGLRANYCTGGYKGHLNISLNEGADVKVVQAIAQEMIKAGMPQEQAIAAAKQKAAALAQELADSKIELDCNQSGWVVTPIIGVDAKIGIVNLAAKYEFITKLTTTNKTKTLQYPEAAKAMLEAYADGVKTPNDIPALLALSAGVEILPVLRVNAEWHFFDDKHAKMAGDRQKELAHGTYEYLGGIEWDVIPRLTLSGGFQYTDYGLTDNFQTDTSFACDSYSLGFGCRVKITKKLSADVEYFWTNYKEYTKTPTAAMPATNTYSRSNKVVGISLNYKF